MEDAGPLRGAPCCVRPTEGLPVPPLSEGQDIGVWWSGALGRLSGDVQRILLYPFESNLSFVIVWLRVSGE